MFESIYIIILSIKIIQHKVQKGYVLYHFLKGSNTYNFTITKKQNKIIHAVINIAAAL